MDLGIHVANFTWANGPAAIGPTLADIAETAETVGVKYFSVMDHYFQMEMMGGPALDMLEGYTTMGFVAGRTEKMILGLLVTGVTYRHPGILAKIVTTLDILSGGRAQLGIGAAWYDREHRGLGIPYPGQIGRYERLEETLQICLQMWSDNNGPYEGKHFQLAETLNLPQSIQRPHPPILIGGGGEKRTLPLVAKYADASNLFSMIGVDGTRHKLGVLKRYCEEIGRDFSEIRHTLLYMGWPEGDGAAFVEEMKAYAALGIEAVILMPPSPEPVAQVAALAGLPERLAEL